MRQEPFTLSRRGLFAGAFALALPAPFPKEPSDPCASATATASFAPSGEPGERLTVTGFVLGADGLRPAAGVILYAFHTDAEGHYTRGPGSTPRLRGWLRTDAEGRYRYTTIRPAPYPGRRQSAHIHTQLWGKGVPPQWGTDLLFEGDPLLTEAERRQSGALERFAFIRPVERRADGLHATHDLRLKTTGDPFEDNTRHGLDGCGVSPRSHS